MDVIIEQVSVWGMLTNNLISTRRQAQLLLEHIASQLPYRPFDPHWVDVDGYFMSMIKLNLNVGQGFTSRDQNHRLMVVLPGEYGNMIYFDRYGGGEVNQDGRQYAPLIACSGHMRDLAPSWDSKSAFSAYVADTDQLCEPLIRRAHFINF